jgi:multiple sugar transport system permease protein
VGVALFGPQFNAPYGIIFAASVVAVVPIGILVFVFRRSVVSGLTVGAMRAKSAATCRNE